MKDFISGFTNAMIYVPFLILLFFILMYLIKLFYEFRYMNINLRANEKLHRDLIELIKERDGVSDE